LAIDFNYLAAKTARHNVELNGLDDTILVIHGKAEEHLQAGIDLLVANLHYEVMKKLVQHELFLRQKWFILSGLLPSEATKIYSMLKERPVLILKKWCQDGIWNTFLGITEN
jgi:ribosomal protein L11 methyltransferase